MEFVESVDNSTLLDRYIESFLQRLKPTYEESFEIKDKGYSLSLSIKDKFRLLLQILGDNFRNSELSLEDLINIFSEWDYWSKLLENSADLSKLNFKDKLKYLNISESYWEIYSQIEQDILTQLKEGKLYDFESILKDADSYQILENYSGETVNKFNRFMNKNSLRGRIFKNDFDQKKHKMMIDSAIRCFTVKHNERELVELLNLLKLWELKYKNSEELLNLLLEEDFDSNTLNYLYSQLSGLKDVQIQNGDLFIEFSPPIYKHQKDIMLRIYKYSKNGWQSRIFSLPNNLEALAFDLQNLRELSIATQTGNLKSSQNKILSETFIIRGIEEEDLLERLNLINSLGGLDILRLNDDLIKPKIDAIGLTIHPFIQSLMANLPNAALNSTELQKFSERYQQVLDAAWMTYMPKHKNISIEDQDKINSNLLQSVVSGNTVSGFVSQNTDVGKNSKDGKVNISEISEGAECGVVNIQIKNINSENKTLPASENSESRNSQSVGNNTLVGNFDKVIGKKGEILEFFDKYNKETKKVERHIKCPICGEGSIDVCDLDQNCPNCGMNGNVIKDAYDKGVLNDLKNKYELEINNNSTSNRQRKNKTPSGLDTFLENLLGFKWLLP